MQFQMIFWSYFQLIISRASRYIKAICTAYLAFDLAEDNAQCRSC